VLPEDLLHAPQIRARHEHIDVGNPPSAAWRKPGGDVRSAFQQNPRLAGVEEGAAQSIDFPPHSTLVPAHERVRGNETIAKPGGRVRRHVSRPHLLHTPAE
jgi:hypothetical protein